jgi:1-acyl-sn-glycerol-3-phosphate acyltransferase
MITVIRTVTWNIVFWFLLIASQLAIPFVLLFDKMGKQRWRALLVSRLVKLWGNALLIASGSKMKVVGRENIPDDHSYCVIANHQGYFDITAILLTIPWTVGFVAKKELAKVPLLNNWMTGVGVVYLDRKDRRTAMKTMQNASERIKKGQPMVVFPEGTRSQGGPVGEFKQGSLKLATLAKTRVLPISIDGTYEMIEGRKKGIHPANITITVHPVIDVEKLSDDEIQVLGKRLRDIIVQPLEASRK